MRSLLFLAACISHVLAAGFPMGFPSTFQNPPWVSAPYVRIPEGVAYAPISGGGYFVSSAASPTVGWLSGAGVWTEVALVETNASFLNYGTFGMEFEASDGTLYVARADLSGALAGTGAPMGALTAFDVTTWTRKWTVSLGAGFANDVTLDATGTVYVTDTALGKIWAVDTTSLQVTIPFSNSSVLGAFCNPVSPYVVIDPTFPNCSAVSVGINGLKYAGASSGGSYLVGGIAQSGISRERLFCFDTDPLATTPFWPLTFLNAASYPTLPTLVADGLIFIPSGSDPKGYLITTGAPDSSFVIELVSGSVWCDPAATYNITWLGSVGGTQSPSQFPSAANGGNSLTTVTYNCDLSVAVALGTSFNPLFGFPPPTENGLFVVGGGEPFMYGVGALPYAPQQYFAAGFDCTTAIPVTPNTAASFYDMACFQGARVSVPGSGTYCGGQGYGIWFYVNTTGLQGLWDITTRTVFTSFDNELSIYSQCPTYCGSQYTDDAFVACEDDVGGAKPPTSWSTTHSTECSASSDTYCARITVNLTATPRTGLYIVVNFYSTPNPSDLQTNTLAFVSHNAAVTVPVQCANNPNCRPARVCNPSLCSAFTDVLTSNGMTVFASPPDILFAAAAGISNATTTPYTVFAPGDAVYAGFLQGAAANGQVECLTNETGPAAGLIAEVVYGWLVLGQNVDPNNLPTANLTTAAGTRLLANSTHIWLPAGSAAMYYGPYCTSAGGNIVGSVYMIDNFVWTNAQMAALAAACPPAACAPNCAAPGTATSAPDSATSAPDSGSSDTATPISSADLSSTSPGPAGTTVTTAASPATSATGTTATTTGTRTSTSTQTGCSGANCQSGSGAQALSLFF